MPLHLTGTSPHTAGVADILRQKFGLAQDVAVRVGVKECLVLRNGVKLVLPVGLADLMNGSTRIGAAQHELSQLGLTALSDAPFATPDVAPDVEDVPSDEELWVQQTASELFPTVIHLKDATHLYQRCHGSSPGAVYCVAFIGPALRGAVRVRGSKLSCRFQSDLGLAPAPEVCDVLGILGVDSVNSDRVTSHVKLNHGGSERELAALLGAYYGALRPWLFSAFPSVTEIKTSQVS